MRGAGLHPPRAGAGAGGPPGGGATDDRATIYMWAGEDGGGRRRVGRASPGAGHRGARPPLTLPPAPLTHRGVGVGPEGN